MKYDVYQIRQDFPILDKKVYNKPLVYFDSAASAQKPNCVIDAVSNYYQDSHANIHRALHYLGEQATLGFEEARAKTCKFIKSKSTDQIIFTKGTTESINLVATSLGRSGLLSAGDEIILTIMEHHSNIVPWQFLAEQFNLNIKVVNILPNGELDCDQLYGLLSERTKILAMAHVSNSLGTINPVKEIINKVKKFKPEIIVSIDGAQATPNLRVDVQDLNCDFYSFSSHKTYGPTGVGVLYGKRELLDKLPPYQGGGEMIDRVILPVGTTYAGLPHKFEAGTPNISGVIAFGVALDYMENFDWDALIAHKQELLDYATAQLETISGLTIFGNAKDKVAVVSFLIENLNAQDIGLLLDQHGVAVRTGHHCNMPLMDFLNIQGTIRASFGIYNTKEEIDIFITSLKQVIKILSS